MPDTTVTPVLDYFREHLYDQTDECMLWPYAAARGYGQVWLDGRAQAVHVLACIAHHGPRPPGMEAAHGPCHNPRCWNGRHLSWRTTAQNHGEDRLRDGTHPRGEGNPKAKLTADDVRAIRAEYARGGVSLRDLGARYGIYFTTVGAIVRRQKWAHID